MRTSIFDLESDGLLKEATKIHVLSIKNPVSGKLKRFAQGDVVEGVKFLQKLADAGSLVGHNILSFDLPLLQKLYPWFTYDRTKVVDTLVMSRLMFSDLMTRDGGHIQAGKLPSKLVGSHKLEAWGYRLGLQKGEYADDFKQAWVAARWPAAWAEATEDDPKLGKKYTKDPEFQATWIKGWAKENYPDGLEWKEYSEDMGDYCDLDVEVTEALWNHFNKLEYANASIELEHEIRYYCNLMEGSGWPFDLETAVSLYAKLAIERDTIRKKMMDTFPPLVIERWSEKTGKRLKDTVIEFNPASRDQIAQRLIAKYGWEPKAFTDGGKPQVDEDILKKLPYEEAQILADYFLLEKRVGQLAEGDQAWLKHERAGHIHGWVNTNGAVTGRCTHSSPNLAQVPSVRALWGPEFRGLFRVRPGFRQVGADLSGLELRCLAHFMAKWDLGAYGEVVLHGDIHTENQTAAGLPTRDNAKTFIYAFLYGAGDEKIGSIVAPKASSAKKRQIGKALKEKFLAGLPALGSLKKAVEKSAKRGHLIGLDGRHVHVRSAHAALNTLLQGAGALISKQWVIECFREAERRGYKYGWDGDFTALGYIHDEVQWAVREGLEEEFGKMVVEMAHRAGEHFNFRCPIDAEFKIGDNWRDCH